MVRTTLTVAWVDENFFPYHLSYDVFLCCLLSHDIRRAASRTLDLTKRSLEWHPINCLPPWCRICCPIGRKL